MKKLLYATFALIASVLVLTACSSDNTSSLLLSGDCMVESFELDGTYTGIVDLRNRTVKVPAMPTALAGPRASRGT